METKNPKANAKLKKKKSLLIFRKTIFIKTNNIPAKPTFFRFAILVVMCYFFVENNQI